MEVSPPMLGATDQTRSCNRWMRDHPCGAMANWHVIWTRDLTNGVVCDEHKIEALRVWVPWMIHAIEPACMGGGSFFVERLNRCLPEFSAERAIALHVAQPV